MMMTLNVKLKSDNDSERRNRGCDSECRKTRMNGGFERRIRKETMRGKYTPVWHAAANLNPLEMAERDSTSLERRSAES